MLKEFDPSGGSNQGSGGIPLEEIGRVHEALGVSEKPEESPAAQEVLNREAEALNKAQTPDALQDPEPEPEPEPEHEAAPEVAAEEVPPPAEEEVDPGVLKALGKKYRGKFGKLTKDYALKDAALAETKGDFAGLSDKVSSLERTVTKAIGQLGGRGTPEPPKPEPQLPPEISREDWEEDPAKAVMAITDYVARQHNTAMFNVMEQREAQRDRQTKIDGQRERLDYHQDRVASIYSKDPAFWEALPQDKATEKLLEQADLLERAEVGNSLLGDVERAAASGGGGRPVQTGAPKYAGLGAGGTPRTRVSAPGGGPPPGGWDKTRAMDALRNSRPDSTDELFRLADILKERGHWPEKKGQN